MIIIEPANPQVVYVPQYNPQVVYTQAPSTTTVVIQEDDDDWEEAVAAGVIGFTAGVAMSSFYNPYYYGGYGWYGGGYMYNDGWDDYLDHREDAREDWADHREDIAGDRGEQGRRSPGKPLGSRTKRRREPDRSPGEPDRTRAERPAAADRTPAEPIRRSRCRADGARPVSRGGAGCAGAADYAFGQPRGARIQRRHQESRRAAQRQLGRVLGLFARFNAAVVERPGTAKPFQQRAQHGGGGGGRGGGGRRR